MIQDFVNSLKLNDIFSIINQGGHIYTLIEKPVNDETCLLMAKMFHNDGWRLQHQNFYFAELSYVNENIFKFSRSVFSQDKTLLGEEFKNEFNENLPKEVSINDKKYQRKQFGFDMYYISDNLPDETYIDLDENYKIIKVRCTRMSGVFVPSQKGKRYFLIAKNVIHCEGIQTSIQFNENERPDYD